MRIKPIINRIAAQCAPYVLVDFPTSLEPVDDLAGTPAAFVHWESEGTTTRDMVVTSQKETITLIVITVAQIIADDGVTEPAEDARDSLKAALIGWAPDGTSVPLTHAGAEVFAIRGDMVHVKDYFQTSIYRRSIN